MQREYRESTVDSERKAMISKEKRFPKARQAGMTTVGIFLGITAGVLVTYYFQVHGIVLPGATEVLRQFGLPERMYPQLSLLSVTTGPGIVLLITLCAALYPVLKVRRLKPVEALAAV